MKKLPKPAPIEPLTPEELRELQERDPKERPLTAREAVQINRAFTRNKPDTLT